MTDQQHSAREGAFPVGTGDDPIDIDAMIANRNRLTRTRILSEAVAKLHEAAAAQRSNTARHTHYSEAAEIVHRMINE